MTAAHHPKINCPVEQWNTRIVAQLCHNGAEHQTNWDPFVQELVYRHNPASSLLDRNDAVQSCSVSSTSGSWLVGSNIVAY